MFIFLTKYDQLSAIALALIFHFGIGLCVIVGGSGNTLLLPQSLRVSLVAPSASLKMKSRSLTDIELMNYTFEKTGIKAAQQSIKNDGKESTERKTSGKETPDATALNSAISEPVFNATYLDNPAPIYPSSAKRDGIQGKVLLLVNVSAHGFAKDVRISESSGYSSLDNAAKNAVLSWKFVPARQYGKAIDAHVLVPIEFKLN